jgi:hypothetical protein
MLKWKLLSRNPKRPKRLYKYTSLSTGLRIVSTNSISFTSLALLNDPLETLAIFRNRPTHREAVACYTGVKEGGGETPDDILRYLDESYEQRSHSHQVVDRGLQDKDPAHPWSTVVLPRTRATEATCSARYSAGLR